MEEVLAKYFSGEATKDEITLVESWRSESKTNANTFFEAKNVWVDAQQETAPPKHVLDEILREQAKQVPLILRNWVKYASAAVLVLAISLLFVLNQNQTDSTYTSQELSDGSEIALHGSSTMEILNMNERVREVSVSGKAYFNIERDESRPFIIHTDNALIKVLGTSFLVKSSESSTEVCVESGLVEFTKDINGSDGGVSVKLAKGEMGLITDNNVGIVKRNNSDLNYLAWKTKVMTFESTPMSEVEKILEDVYGIDVQFENPAFKNCKLTAKFNKKKVKEALEIISRTFKIEYEYSDGKAVLKGLGC